MLVTEKEYILSSVHYVSVKLSMRVAGENLSWAANKK